jgi:hypothetical protein
MLLYPQLEAFLTQGKEEHTSLGDGYANLSKIMEAAPSKGSGR